MLADKARVSVATVAAVERQDGRGHTTTRGDATFRMTDVIWDRLQKRHHGRDGVFQQGVWLLLCRYQSLTGYQGTVRRKGLKYLFNRYDVTYECFASPLDAYLDTFTSGFFPTLKRRLL